MSDNLELPAAVVKPRPPDTSLSRAYRHPQVRAASDRIKYLLAMPWLPGETREWLCLRHGELAWVEIVVSRCGHLISLPETDLRPETRCHARHMLRTAAQTDPSSLHHAAGLLFSIEGQLNALESLDGIRRLMSGREL